MGMSCRLSSSFFSKNGILMPALPISTFGVRRRPEMI